MDILREEIMTRRSRYWRNNSKGKSGIEVKMDGCYAGNIGVNYDTVNDKEDLKDKIPVAKPACV